jgi:hypothetical protein
LFLPPSDKNSSLPSSSFLFFSAIISAIGLSSSNSSQTTFKMAAKTKQNHMAVPNSSTNNPQPNAVG